MFWVGRDPEDPVAPLAGPRVVRAGSPSSAGFFLGDKEVLQEDAVCSHLLPVPRLAPAKAFLGLADTSRAERLPHLRRDHPKIAGKQRAGRAPRLSRQQDGSDSAE